MLEGHGERGSTRARGQQVKWEVKYNFQSPLEKKLQKQLEVRGGKEICAAVL